LQLPPPDMAMGPPDLVPDPVPIQMFYDVMVRTYTQPQAELIVKRLYRALLGRDAEPGGLAGWWPQVAAGNLPRVVSSIITSPEFEGRRPSLTATGLAETLYVKILDRP